MSMQDQKSDWLDERLAVNSYLPDEGFTAQVIGRLPETRPKVALLRSRILFLTMVFAFGLATGMAIMKIGSLLQAFNRLATHGPLPEILTQIARLAQHPGVIYGGAAAIILLGFVSIPWLRRWV
jgi:hypothetical protein